MVRLLLNVVLNTPVVVVFQSHNGAIAANTVVLKVNANIAFQSHNGAIAATDEPEDEKVRLCFNPTMVRLLQFIPSFRSRSHLWFQSHNGAIAACCPQHRFHLRLSYCFNPTMVRLLLLLSPSPQKRCRCFNPTMVRLLPNFPANPLPKRHVSIPQWCDCCICQRGCVAAGISGFNPTMVRLLHWKFSCCFHRRNNVSIPQWCDCCPLHLLL